jgi:electron transport complex protein RnfE
MNVLSQIRNGLVKENPIFRLVLGMCPTLAVTTSLEKSLGMGVATTFVLVCSNVVISALRKYIPAKVRIPCFIVIIATFVTIVQFLMAAYATTLNDQLGIFIPLIVVNCVILGRAEAFASRNGVVISIADGIGMGAGFTLGLAALGACREILGAGTLTIWGDLAFKIPAYSETAAIMTKAPGGFIMLGLLLALMNHVQARAAVRRGEAIPRPVELNCRHCTLCKWGA